MEYGSTDSNDAPSAQTSGRPSDPPLAHALGTIPHS